LLVFNKNHEERGLIIDKTGKIWFGFWSPGFYCYDPKQDTIIEIILDSSDKKENIEKIVGPIVEDDKDNFFVSTYHSGIYYFNPRKNKVEEHFLNDPADPNSIISSSINALYYDNQKTLWVGTDGGISEFNKANNLFDYPVQQKNFTPNALLQSKDGHIWIGTYAGKGLFEFNEHFKLLHQYKVFEGVYNFNENGTWTLGQTHDGKIMVCRQGGFSLINPVTKEQNDFTDMRDLSARATINAYEDEQKNIWIGTTHAKLICLDSTHKHISIVPTSDWTFIMGKIGDKLLLNFHTNQHKFYCFDISTKQIHLEPYFFFKKRDSILVNQTQNIFTGIKFYGSYVYITTLRGLYVLNNQTGAVQHYTRANGLPSDEVSVLQKDSKGNIWLGTKQGLCVFDPVSKQFHGYGESEGLRNLEFQQFAMTQLNNGLMLACDNNNLVAFYPDSIMSVPVPPAPVITSLRIGNNEVPVSPNQKYFVSYKENNININFISLDFVHTRSIKYAYKLEGFDKDWRYVDNITSATYDNLDGGNYIFKVKAANAMGEWNTTITSLYFFISVPFYKQTWFFVLIAIIVIAILYTFYRMRIQRIIELQRVRNSISRDLHDEVGSTLSSISMLSTTAQHSLQNKEAGSAEMLIERISSSSQRILDVIDEIIWTINPRNDSLEDIIIRIRSFINDIVDTQGIKINMQADSLLEKINMPMKLKRNFYLIIKEALNNAANHAQCKTIDILIEKKHQSVLLQIKDDGKGFNAAKSFEGNGLKNMHQRAHEIRGEIKIKSEINKGTLLMLTVPIP
jgi:two-component sensor histidine kinase